MRPNLFSAALLIVILAADRLLGDGSLAGGALLAFAAGHCDTLDGPVIKLARRALESGKVNLVLPWVRERDEPEIREAFAHAQEVRKLGAEAKSLADQHFFETLVRVHRAGEGAPYTGLKPAAQDLGPAVPAADKAIEDGSVDRVVNLLTEAVRKGVHEHFHRAIHHRDFDPEDVSAGREYVDAYVPYVHYVEKLWDVASSSAAHAHREHAH